MLAYCNDAHDGSLSNLQLCILQYEFAFRNVCGMALTPTSLAKALSISVPYASQILSGKRDMSRDMAVQLFRKTGDKLGPIAKATDREIAILESFPERVRLRSANDETAAAEPPVPRQRAA